jgi:hypothetical protein
MKIYEEANSMNLDIEAGLRDLQEGNVSPTFTDTKEAMDWLNN